MTKYIFIFSSLIFIVSLFINYNFHYIVNEIRSFFVGDVRQFSWYKKKEVDFRSYILNDKKNNVLIVGDSLSESIPIKNMSRNFEFFNYSIPGETTSYLLSRIDSIPYDKFDYAIIMIGVNDLGQNKDVLDVFENFKLISCKLSSVKKYVIVISVLFTDGYKRDNRDIYYLNSLVDSYSREKGFLYLDMNLFFSENNVIQDVFTSDGIHLNDVAYSILVEKLDFILNENENQKGQQ